MKNAIFFSKTSLTSRRFPKSYFGTLAHYLWFKTYPEHATKLGRKISKQILDQFLTFNLDQFLTYETPNLGPILTLQQHKKNIYIYIYLYTHIYYPVHILGFLLSGPRARLLYGPRSFFAKIDSGFSHFWCSIGILGSGFLTTYQSLL